MIKNINVDTALNMSKHSVYEDIIEDKKDLALSLT